MTDSSTSHFCKLSSSQKNAILSLASSFPHSKDGIVDYFSYLSDEKFRSLLNAIVAIRIEEKKIVWNVLREQGTDLTSDANQIDNLRALNIVSSRLI